VTHHVSSLKQWIRARQIGVRSLVQWFDFDPRVSLRVARRLWIPRADVGLLTHWTTAEAAPALRARAQVLAQVAYDYEFWRTTDPGTRPRMERALRLPDVSVATSRPVAAMLRAAGRTPDATIPCGIDKRAFHVEIDPANRPITVGVLARRQEFKRTSDAIHALEAIHRDRDFRVLATGSRDVALPSWFERCETPDDAALRQFYNRVAIFVLPSEHEGWGLPAAEAMACGAAVVATRSGGVEDFAVHGENALLVPTRDPDALAGAVARLIEDDELRLRIARDGTQTATAMSWTSAVDDLEALLVASLDARTRTAMAAAAGLGGTRSSSDDLQASP
jgi:glycosyltransferase involved in cell wall biosynthesis